MNKLLNALLVTIAILCLPFGFFAIIYYPFVYFGLMWTTIITIGALIYYFVYKLMK